MSTTTLRTTTLIGDIATVCGRELRPVLRDPFSVIFSMVQPLFFLALFAPLLPDTVGSGDSLQWFVPGVVLMSCLFGTSATGANLLSEMHTGAHERMLVSPLRRSALIIGRALKEIVPTLVQTAVIVAATVPFGFDLHLAGASVGLLVVAVFCVGLGALSYALALAARKQEWMFWAVQQTFIFPLLLLAGVLLPIDGGPGWLVALSRVNPLTYVVTAERALFNGEIATAAVAAGALAATATAVLGLAVGIRMMERSAT